MNDEIKEAGKEFGDKLNDFADMAEDEFTKLYGEEGKMECVVNFVRDRPLLSLGLASFAGMILAWMLKGCCCRKAK